MWSQPSSFLLILVVTCTSLALFGCGGEDTTAAPAPTPAAAEWTRCDHIFEGTPKDDTAVVPSDDAYATALQGLDMSDVKADMDALLSNQNDCWPVSGGHYGPFMVRLAWHCSGTYRASDGVGGCAGGRMRFEPERSWPDNTNLDKARALLYPLKMKYGDALSWGDLFVLAGTQAYRVAGAPLTRMCFGRIDETDGSASNILNEACDSQGNCSEPHGATTVGLIYVNPEGPMGNPDPSGSAAEVRRTFTTMGHDDRSTVALIGGGHTIGKCHGACNAPNAAGQPPKDAFANDEEIYKGACGNGIGENTFTSGFEGYWTTNHLAWDNEYFTELLPSSGNNWEKHMGPGGHYQWRPSGRMDKNIFRLTSDMALLEDASYAAIVQEFSDDMDAFNAAFDQAWYDLTTYNGNGRWSSAAKCDDGNPPTLPEATQQNARVMRGDDVAAMMV